MTLFNVIYAFLNWNVEALRVFFVAPNARLLTLQIVLLAVLSAAVGQSIVLFANQIRPRRFIFSLLLSTVVFLVGYLAWVLSLWLALRLFFNYADSLDAILYGVGLSYLPLMFGFLALLPYLGNPITALLYLWTFLTLIRMQIVFLGIPDWGALLCAATGGVLVLVMRATIGRPVLWLHGWLQSKVAGRRLQFDLDTLYRARRQRTGRYRDR